MMQTFHHFGHGEATICRITLYTPQDENQNSTLGWLPTRDGSSSFSLTAKNASRIVMTFPSGPQITGAKMSKVRVEYTGIQIMHKLEQWIWGPFNHGGYDNPTGGGGGDHGGRDQHSSHWFSQPPERGKTALYLIGAFFNRRADSSRLKLALVALLVQCLFHKNVHAYADTGVSPLKPSTGTLEKLHDEQEEGRPLEAASVDVVWELQGGKWRKLLVDTEKDEFVVDSSNDNVITKEKDIPSDRKGHEAWALQKSVRWCWEFARSLMLPEGYPDCVTGDYLEYTLWRMGQGIASQINGVLTTQALLYAVGLGKGAIPTAAAVNWVLKDGIGYLSKILLAKYGRHFDVHPKGWRLLADLIENAAYGLELLTPTFPHLFVFLGAAAGAGRSAAGLIQAATRSCFYAGFAAQRNFAEVIAKGEAQGMVSKSLGILLGIAISGYVGSSGPLLVGSFLAVSGAHMLCNLRSYQAVQLRTLNPYRASLVFSEYLRTGIIAPVVEVNAEEPIFTEVPLLAFKLRGHKHCNYVLSSQSKEDAAVLATKLNVGTSFSNVIRSQAEADRLFKLYQNEQYVLAECHNQYQVLLKVGASSHDLLRMMLQVCCLHQLESRSSKSLPMSASFSDYSHLETSYKSMLVRFDQLQQDLASAGWITSDGLVSRPLPYRVQEIHS